MKKRGRMKSIVTKYSLGIVFVLLACMLFTLPVLSRDLKPASNGTAYYVSPSGSDTNPGTESQPWQTIQKAADTLVAGDTVYIKAGTYQERVEPQNSGSAGSYITYTAYTGDTVTIDGSTVTLPSDWGGLFDVSSKAYIIISGLRIINAGPNNNNPGILVDESSYITIEKNYTNNTVSSGIGVWNSNNIIIDGNEVELACNDGEQECITVAVTDTFEIKNNHVHHGGPGTIGGEGIDVKDGSSNGKVYRNHVHDLNNRVGIYVDSWDKHTHDIDVYQNVVYNVVENDGFTFAAESGGLLENIKIYNNIAYNNTLNGISLSENGDASTKPMKNIYVVNNTFYNNGTSSWGGCISLENADADDVVIRNNICSQNVYYQILVEKIGNNLTIDHNLIDGYRGYEDFETYGTDYVEGDPLFVSASGLDFQLQQASPAIDKGSSSDAPADDYAGNVRPYGAGYDIGAYEYGSVTATTTTTTDGPCPAEEIYGGGSEETQLLRYIRDNVLMQTPEGQEIIKLYYQWSPVIVQAMENDAAFKEEVKEMVDGVLELIE